MAKKETSNKDSTILPVITIGVILFGILTLFLMQKYSTNNKYICKYLGRLWEKKVTDTVHRCDTWEELYSDDK